MAAPITAYFRTLNEERMIARAIHAAKLAAQEVVIIDSGSTDNTIEIAESAGARVIRQSWLGNGKQKRVGEDAAAHNWLLDLDADEIVTPDLANEITNLFSRGEPANSIYEIPLITAPPIGEPWKKVAIAHRNKLYDRRTIRIPDHAAWDQFDPPRNAKTGKLKAAILHYSYRDFEHFMGKLNRVSTVRATKGKLKPYWLVAMRVVMAPPFYFLKHFIGRGHWRNGLYGIAIAGMSANGRWLRDIKMLELYMKRAQDRRQEANTDKRQS